MFTGIIQAVGEIAGIETSGNDSRLRLRTGKLPMHDVQLGDSIAVNGVCLTAVSLGPAEFSADVSAETLAHTTLGGLGIGARVNLELALTPTTRLGGHLVSGHVDGVGQLLSRHADGRSIRMRFEAPRNLARYIAAKGSICIDGTSLTVNEVQANQFGINIVPHTAVETIIDGYRPGTRVNLEVDLIARYLERLLQGGLAPEGEGGVTETLLARAGFIKAG